MKKFLLMMAMVLVIVGSMAAGTMAQYVKSTSQTVNPQFKSFNFSAVNTSSADVLALKLAPGESKTWTLSTSNSENGVYSEANMIVTLGLVTSNVPAGLTFYVNDELYTGSTLPVAEFLGGSAHSQPFTLKVEWKTSGDVNDTSWQGYNDASVTLNLTATQASIADFPSITSVSDESIPSSMLTQSSHAGTAFTNTYGVKNVNGNILIKPVFTITGINDANQLKVTTSNCSWFIFKSIGVNTFADRSGTYLFDGHGDLPDNATYTVTYLGNVIGTYTINLEEK